MKKLIVFVVAVTSLVACQDKEGGKDFIVKGTIRNNPAKKIYLEEIPMASNQRIVADSTELGKDGSFELSTKSGESSVYTIRLDQNQFPVTAVINDESPITVTVDFADENKQFPSGFEVKGSTASIALKDYIMAFNNKMQDIFLGSMKADSLQNNNAPEAEIIALHSGIAELAVEAKGITDSLFAKNINPALSMFVLGYYQSTAMNPATGLIPYDREGERSVVDALAAKFPGHSRLATLKASMEGLVGKQAPEIALPDPNGKEVKLSSFQGKYVLVDFWASWCKPCREENPNVVKAFNKYKDRNFTVLGVSLDRPDGKDNWMQAVMKDNLTWTHVSDLKFWDSQVVPLYKIEGIPYNVLVDPQGKIIAENLRGPALERKLEQVLN
ncbi:MAG TPA: TlpA disulfide reductase family protein [Chitinophagaceae bacterium]|nr:AhpC/TSA family protein [Chitinophagaceae bacterium]MCB9055361.1 AhpC/TSA family protein [Chitinophagales bacterium]HPG11545.1 TlpA disulfide reductase family protein [Chitinophagaceae bacterium]HRX93245.1 TlpA disulfide reductase family protein [Chitinophagaceae bacterium]